MATSKQLDNLPTETRICLEALKEKISKDGGVLFDKLGFAITDNKLATLCMAKKNNAVAVYELLKRVLQSRINKPLSTISLTPSSVEEILKSQRLIRHLKKRTGEGKLVQVLRLGAWDLDNWNQESLLKFALLYSDYILNNFTPSQIIGASLVIDWNGFDFRHFRFYLSFILRYTSVFRGMPSFEREIHMINNKKLTQMLISAAKRFFSEKTIGKIVVHTQEFNKLKEISDPTGLPEWLDDYRNEKEDAFDDAPYDQIMQREETYQELHRIAQSMRR